jgi:hypothetical protein
MKLYGIGDRVVQPEYGPGTVTAADARHTVIDFDQHGTRKFVTTMVSLSATTEPAPTKPSKAGGRRAPRKKA